MYCLKDGFMSNEMSLVENACFWMGIYVIGIIQIVGNNM